MQKSGDVIIQWIHVLHQPFVCLVIHLEKINTSRSLGWAIFCSPISNNIWHSLEKYHQGLHNDRLPNHPWICLLSKHTYEFPTLRKNCVFCSANKGNGFANASLYHPECDTKNSCISIFGDEVLMQVSSEQYLQSHQVTQNKCNCCQFDMS